MSILVTPSLLNHRAELYQQLGSLISAGVPVIQALEQLHRNPPSGSFRRELAQLISLLQLGEPLCQGMKQIGNWMPTFDLALLEAGERSGRLDQCFRLLAEYYRERAQLARQVLLNVLYPVALLHLAVFIFPTEQLAALVWRGESASFLLKKLSLLGPVYAVAALAVYLSQGGRSELWRSFVEKLTRAVPLLGTARRDLALARLAAALEALLNAGVPIIEAWQVAAAASGSPVLRIRVQSWRTELEAASTPAELLQRSREFPELFANLYHSGEVSGRLDDTLRRLHRYYQEEGSRKMQLLAQWFPRLVYFIIALFVVWKVFSFWLGYFQQLNQLM